MIFKAPLSPAKGVVRVTAARVQIPASPLKPRNLNGSGVFHCSRLIHIDTLTINPVTLTVTLTRYSQFFNGITGVGIVRVDIPVHHLGG